MQTTAPRRVIGGALYGAGLQRYLLDGEVNRAVELLVHVQIDLVLPLRPVLVCLEAEVQHAAAGGQLCLIELLVLDRAIVGINRGPERLDLGVTGRVVQGNDEVKRRVRRLKGCDNIHCLPILITARQLGLRDVCCADTTSGQQHHENTQDSDRVQATHGIPSLK